MPRVRSRDVARLERGEHPGRAAARLAGLTPQQPSGEFVYGGGGEGRVAYGRSAAATWVRSRLAVAQARGGRRQGAVTGSPVGHGDAAALLRVRRGGAGQAYLSLSCAGAGERAASLEGN